MFRLVRFFTLTSAASAAVLIGTVVVYRHTEVTEQIRFAESQNVTLARSFANTIWPQFSAYVTSASRFDRNGLAQRPETRAIDAAVRAVSAGLPTLKVKIYSLDGLTVYSSALDEIGEDKSTNPGFFAAARGGEPASKLTYRDTFSSFEGTVQERDLVESYLPIRRGEGPVEGVFELYTDITPLLDRVRRATTNFVVGGVLVFVLVFGALFLTVRRADHTIRQQYADITDKRDALEREMVERKQMQEALKQAHDELERRVAERTRDLTEEIAERRRAEVEARRHRDQLAHFGRISVMGEMATSLAHELNQPLTVISGCAQVCLDRLRSRRDGAEELRDSIEQVAEQAGRANEIIRRIRGFVHKQDRERTEIDVNAAIRDVAELLRVDAREHGAAITFDLAEDLPTVVADTIQIQQVILNLAHNGMEAMSESAPDRRRLTIHTSARRQGGVEVAVRDEGHGIPPESLERVYEPFFTTKSNGLGMGLSISRSIVEAHGGRLWATSDGARGAVFRFTLPVAERVSDGG